jgi:hypothetical protein
MLGMKFGRLTVLMRTARKGHFWCRCECGGHSEVRRDALRSGNTKSCGCLFREAVTTHGHSTLAVARRSSEYSSWDHMIQRCANERDKHYSRYGARGITVCERWRNSFEAFLEDMGPKPTPEHTIDRIEVNGNYEPGNCRWATRTEQMLNQRRTVYVTWEGERIPLTALARRHGACPKVVAARVRKGWELGEALSRAVDKTRSHTGPRNRARPCRPQPQNGDR